MHSISCKSRFSLFWAALLSCLLLLPSSALAERTPEGAAAKRVVSTIDKVRETVKEAGGKAEDSLTPKLEEIIFPVFNFKDMSRACLGKNWKVGNEKQQEEFVQLFSKLLSRTYLNRIKEIESSSVEFIGEKVKGKRAIVKTLVTKDGQKYPISYRLRDYGSDWRVYDVVIENISLVSNYREDFSSIIRRKEFDGLLEMLREKTASEA